MQLDELYPTVCSRLFVAQTIFEMFFFEISIVSCGVQLIEGSAIFGTSFNVSCCRAVNFELKLLLDPDESAQKFRERRRIRLFFLRMMLDCLECVLSSKNPFLRVSLENVKEIDLILTESYSDRSKKEPFEKISIQIKNDFEPRGNRSITV